MLEQQLMQEIEHLCDQITTIEISEPGDTWSTAWMEHAEITTGHANDRWGIVTREVMRDIDDVYTGTTVGQLRQHLADLQHRGAWDVLVTIPENMADQIMAVAA